MPHASGSFQEPRRLHLQGPLAGSLRVPGSKSLAQRALLAAALAQGRSELLGLPEGKDVKACLGVVRALGAIVEIGEPGQPLAVVGLAGSLASAEASIDVGESGTLARLCTGILALGGPGRMITLQPAGSLVRRKSAALLACLASAGAELECPSSAEATWPLSIRGTSIAGPLELQEPSSSQEVSALWFAAALDGEEHEVVVSGPVPSAPYLDLSEQVLSQFGVQLIHDRSQPRVLRTRLRGPLRSPGRISIEADASSAAVALAAACLSGGELRCPGIPEHSSQGDVAILECLAAFGCETKREPDALWAAGRPTRAAHLNLERQPDLAPVLTILAAAAAEASGEHSELQGLGTLPGKESDRLAVLALGLGAAGWQVQATAKSLRIGPPNRSTPQGLVLDPAGDHRMAFAFALLALLRPEVLVANPSCVSKSWPGFWEAIEACL